MSDTLPTGKDRHLAFLLFIVPGAMWLWPPFYNYVEPKLFDIPFFYWFQVLWVIVTALIIAVVYLLGG